MAFPQVVDADTQSGLQSSNSTSWTLTYPTNLASGDLILAIVGVDGSTIGPTWPSGFIGGSIDQGTVFLAYAKKKSDGTETGNFTLTLENEQGCWRVLRIIDWEGTLGTNFSSGAVNSTTGTTGTGLNPDPPILNPTDWGVEETLWIAAAASDHGNTTYTGFPTNYTNTSAQESGGANGAALGTARLELAVGTENPDAFTTDASDGWAANTIAIRPAAVYPPYRSPYHQLLAH